MRPAKEIEEIVRTMSFRAGPEAIRSFQADLARAAAASQATRRAQGRFREKKMLARRPFVRMAAAAAVILVLGIGAVGILRPFGQTAYAFGQTVDAMRGKRSFHIQTYLQSRPTDEFWAEFDEAGRLIRFRQEEERNHYSGPVVTVWEDGVRQQYCPMPIGINLVTHVANVDGRLEGLEEFDPETLVEEACDEVTDGRATIETKGPLPDQNVITVTVTLGQSLKRVLWVNRETKLLMRMEEYHLDDESGGPHRRAIEVLGYNEPLDPALYRMSLPEGTITVDQVTQEVGMAQGGMTEEEIAPQIVRQALEAWAAGDYANAGKLFGGAPSQFFTERYGHLRPVRILAIGQAVPVPYTKPWFQVPCEYEVEQDGRITTYTLMLNVLAVDGQPKRWYVSIQHKA